MKSYTLLNKTTGKKLTHPKTGLWFTTELGCAESTLADCYQYLDAVGLSHIKNNFVIVNAETNEEIIRD